MHYKVFMRNENQGLKYVSSVSYTCKEIEAMFVVCHLIDAIYIQEQWYQITAKIP